MVASKKGKSPSFRDAIDVEMAFVLSHDENFLADLQHIREREGIPKLKYSSDRWRHDTMVYDEIIEMIDSRWLDAKVTQKKKERIDRDVEGLVVKYNLPFYFNEWVRLFILYCYQPKERPTFMDNDLISSIARGKTLHFSLSTKEKAFWLGYFRSRLGFEKGRVPKKYARAYRELREALNNRKNTRRRSHTYRDTIRVENLLKQPLVWSDYGMNKSQKKTYMDVVVELSPMNDKEYLSGEKDKLAVAKLRQRVSRLKRRK